MTQFYNKFLCPFTKTSFLSTCTSHETKKCPSESVTTMYGAPDKTKSKQKEKNLQKKSCNKNSTDTGSGSTNKLINLQRQPRDFSLLLLILGSLLLILSILYQKYHDLIPVYPMRLTSFISPYLPHVTWSKVPVPLHTFYLDSSTTSSS